MAADRDLARLLAGLQPTSSPGRYVFVTVPAGETAPHAVATVIEEEGLSAVVPQTRADARGWSYDLVCGWITLAVHSALDAVGLTAAVAGALADEGIPANVVAGRHHDHLLVPIGQVGAAMAVLRGLSGSA